MDNIGHNHVVQMGHFSVTTQRDHSRPWIILLAMGGGMQTFSLVHGLEYKPIKQWSLGSKMVNYTLDEQFSVTKTCHYL